MGDNLDFLEKGALFRVRKLDEEGVYKSPDEKHVSRPFPAKSGKIGENCEQLKEKVTTMNSLGVEGRGGASQHHDTTATDRTADSVLLLSVSCPL